MFEVGDDDFTKFSLIPSVTLSVEIPEDVTGSWYDGEVFIGLKEGVFEPSSPHRHMTELLEVIQNKVVLRDKCMLFIYSDGGPDHRLTYLSVQLSLIALYLALDLDYLCAARTAPFHSWGNPAERVMSIVNLGLGLMRKEMQEQHESLISHCNNVAQLQQIGQQKPDIIPIVSDSIAPVKVLLSDIFCRLKLHDKNFQVFTAASVNNQERLWSELKKIDDTLEYGVHIERILSRITPT